jgi:hypothetical protein
MFTDRKELIDDTWKVWSLTEVDHDAGERHLSPHPDPEDLRLGGEEGFLLIGPLQLIGPIGPGPVEPCTRRHSRYCTLRVELYSVQILHLDQEGIFLELPLLLTRISRA